MIHATISEARSVSSRLERAPTKVKRARAQPVPKAKHANGETIRTADAFQGSVLFKMFGRGWGSTICTRGPGIGKGTAGQPSSLTCAAHNPMMHAWLHHVLWPASLINDETEWLHHVLWPASLGLACRARPKLAHVEGAAAPAEEQKVETQNPR